MLSKVPAPPGWSNKENNSTFGTLRFYLNLGVLLFVVPFWLPQSSTVLTSFTVTLLYLVSAYLDDKPFYLFDEWAADQDPTFKRVFYTELLPELKARGKTVIVITHDDAYFQQADRVLKVESGRLIQVEAHAAYA